MLRILSYNIHGGRARRRKERTYAAIHRLLARHTVDIAVLQEVDSRPSRGGTEQDLAILAGDLFPHAIQGPTLREDGGWYGNLILSRHPVQRSWTHNLDTAQQLEPRHAIDAVIASPHGPVRIIGTHLSLKPAARLHELQTLLRLVAAAEARSDMPILLMGDLNEWRFLSKFFGHLNREMKKIPTRATFPARFPFLKLDRVWMDGAWPARATALRDRETKTLSDHLPVLVDLAPPLALP